jgi:hypothetical protein
MYKFHAGMKTILLCGISSLLTGCQYWLIEEIHVIKNKKLFVEVWGKNSVLERNKVSGSPDAEIKIYTDDYTTLLTAETFTAGDQLEHEHEGARQIFSNQASNIRVGNSSGQYKMICVEFKLNNSNFDDYTKIGCVYADGYDGLPHEPTDGPFPP